MKLYTIGFTQKTAERFFDLLTSKHVDVLIDVRLNNKSQLAGFAKDPDLCFFLSRIGKIFYIHDTMLAPTEELLKKYRAKEISWEQYETIFETIMKERNIDQYIHSAYEKYKGKAVCLLCSEPTADKCHRKLVAQHFSGIFLSETEHL